ncbi:hypothetical protein RRG08_045978 [Elysia crispata]|uniref:Dynein heavy chain tail domain-containing protein n=1 Tax=Elysia crispata TaxID=231223 RepID=A0AAE1E3A2_9GAST|nr:hypothetical protein RRG08_045978 [Elysia crispata]
MDDARFEWIRDRVYLALGLRKAAIFEQFLETQETELATFLNKKMRPLDESVPILFYKLVVNVNRESQQVSDPESSRNAVFYSKNILPQTSETTLESVSANPANPANPAVVESLDAPDIVVSASGETLGNIGSDHRTFSGKLATSSSSALVTDSIGVSGPKKTSIVRLYMVWGNLPEDVANSGAHSVFFTRVASDMVPVYDSKLEAEKDMPNHVEYGLLNGNALGMLEKTLNLLYHPLLVYNQYRGADSVDDRLYAAATSNHGKAEDGNWQRRSMEKASALVKHSPTPSREMEIGYHSSSETAASKKKSSRPEGLTASGFSRDEFLIGMQKFMQSIEKKLQEIQGSLKFVVPDVALTGKPQIDLQDVQTMKLINEAVQNFQYQVDALLEETLSMPRRGEGPLAEIKYWKERDRILSGVVDQLHDPKIKYILELHMRTELEFELTRKDLVKYAVEAHDNVRFLSTLERHFRNIKYGTTFQTVTETLAPMMNAMRMIWIISRHYNTDELMVPLMSRIAWELCERVVRVVNVSTLFKLEASTIKKITSSAVTMLDTWKSSYLFIRAKIETSGRGIRWEFDRRKLFDRTEYMAIICKDLHDMAQVIEEFLNIFSQELKNVTGDAERIDEVVDQVYELVEPIMQLPYDIFSPVRASSWNNLKVKFYKRVKEIEQTAKVFIDDSFQSLRSSEGAFELLMKLKNIKSRETVNQRMQSKFRNVIMQFNKEVESTAAIFMENKVKPPVFRNYPPVSGSIYWERFLVHRIKSSIIHFQSMQEMMSTDLGKMATHKYLTTAKSMRKYELQVAGMWSEAVERLLNQYLSCPLITKSDASPADLEGRFSDSEELAQLGWPKGSFVRLRGAFSACPTDLEGRFSDSEELAQTNPADLEGRFSDSEELAQLGSFLKLRRACSASTNSDASPTDLEGRFSDSEELAQVAPADPEGRFTNSEKACSACTKSDASPADLEGRLSDSEELA